jgi:hypothetical protein
VAVCFSAVETGEASEAREKSALSLRRQDGVEGLDPSGTSVELEAIDLLRRMEGLTIGGGNSTVGGGLTDGTPPPPVAGRASPLPAECIGSALVGRRWYSRMTS